MKSLIASLALAAAILPANSALACAPPPPGWVQPTEVELLESYVNGASDIVYGIVTGGKGDRSRFNVIHVYKGSLAKGETVEVTAGWDFPVPSCAGMAGPPRPAPIGTYGVATFRNGSPSLSFIPPRHVQTMIGKGWIKSARAR